MQGAGSTTVIERVRLKRSPMEAPAARLRLSYLFSSVTLGPRGMAPSAVLVIRSMSDPLPGCITKEFASGRDSRCRMAKRCADQPGSAPQASCAARCGTCAGVGRCCSVLPTMESCSHAWRSIRTRATQIHGGGSRFGGVFPRGLPAHGWTCGPSIRSTCRRPCNNCTSRAGGQSAGADRAGAGVAPVARC